MCNACEKRKYCCKEYKYFYDAKIAQENYEIVLRDSRIGLDITLEDKAVLDSTLNGTPINYRPCILPRSQDMEPVYEETTGLYGMSKSSLEKYHCRIGSHPYICEVSKFEAVDINTEEDFALAEHIGKVYWKL